MQKRLKSYGERYAYTSVKVKINKVKVLKILFITLVVCEIVLGVLWAVGL